MPTEAPPAVATSTTPPAPVEALDIGQIKSMLNLPEATSDVELIQTLVQLIAGLQYKYDALLADAVEMEDKVANRVLDDFQDVVVNDTREFWRDSYLENRDKTIETLTHLRNSKRSPSLSILPPVVPDATPAAAPVSPPPAQEHTPLFRNRSINPVRSIAQLSGENPQSNQSVAVQIRNRAQAIRAAEKVSYINAFARAEKEFTNKE